MKNCDIGNLILLCKLPHWPTMIPRMLAEDTGLLVRVKRLYSTQIQPSSEGSFESHFSQGEACGPDNTCLWSATRENPELWKTRSFMMVVKSVLYSRRRHKLSPKALYFINTFEKITQSLLTRSA